MIKIIKYKNFDITLFENAERKFDFCHFYFMVGTYISRYTDENDIKIVLNLVDNEVRVIFIVKIANVFSVFRVCKKIWIISKIL